MSGWIEEELELCEMLLGPERTDERLEKMKSGAIDRIAHRRHEEDGSVGLRFTQLPVDVDPTLVGLDTRDLDHGSDVCSGAAFVMVVIAVIAGGIAIDHAPSDASTTAAWTYVSLGLALIAMWLLRRRKAYLLRLGQLHLDAKDADASSATRREVHRAMRLEERVAELEAHAAAWGHPGDPAGGCMGDPDPDDGNGAMTVHSRSDEPPHVHD